jgi:hypothetical protein
MTSTQHLLSKGYFYANDITCDALFGRLCDDLMTSGVSIADTSSVETYGGGSSGVKSHALQSPTETSGLTSSFDKDLLKAPSRRVLEDSVGLGPRPTFHTEDHQSEASQVLLHTDTWDDGLANHADIRFVTNSSDPCSAARCIAISTPTELQTTTDNDFIDTSDQSLGNITLVEPYIRDLFECKSNGLGLLEPAMIPDYAAPRTTYGLADDLDNETSPVNSESPAPSPVIQNPDHACSPQSDGENYIVELFKRLSLDSTRSTKNSRSLAASIHATLDTYIPTHGGNTLKTPLELQSDPVRSKLFADASTSFQL